MLFDLRSRGRRRTVQVIYAMLALVMLSGLLLVGVGTGSGGGILNAFTNNGSGNNSSSVKSSAEKAAEKLTKQQPTNASAWSQLVQAQWSDYTGQTKVAAAKQVLHTITVTYEHYLTLTKTPDPDTALLASRAYAYLGDFSKQAAAREIVANANPTSSAMFQCWAAALYAAKNTTLGDQAAAKAIALTPKAAQFELKNTLNQAKTSTNAAVSC